MRESPKINRTFAAFIYILMKFEDLGISSPILKALEEKGYSVPTPIQQQAIPIALEERDLLGIAQTGTGKTAAFAIPIIQKLSAEKPDGGPRPIRALILTPTRELALQIDECFSDYARHTPVRHCVIFGGVNQRPQVEKLHRGVDILIATPGRLLDLMGQGHVKLGAVSHFVMDEADRMLDMGFINDIRRIVHKLPQERQTLFFSATMPDTIVSLSQWILRKPARVEVTPDAPVVETIDQFLYFVEKPDKKDLLIDLLRKDKDKSALVFARTKHGADRIAKILGKAGISSEAIHGDKAQGSRQRTLAGFKSGKIRVMIATDIAARGLDITELPLVINYDLPDVVETYVHRIGRTGRAGHTGRAVSFCTEEEHMLVRDIQKLTGKTLPADMYPPQ